MLDINISLIMEMLCISLSFEALFSDLREVMWNLLFVNGAAFAAGDD